MPAIKSINYALFQSHLLYCPSVISCSSKSNIDRISKMQKKVIRIISNATYNAHTAPLFANLHIMPYTSIIKHAKLTIMHSYHYKYILASFAGTWQTNADCTGRAELRNADDYGSVILFIRLVFIRSLFIRSKFIRSLFIRSFFIQLQNLYGHILYGQILYGSKFIRFKIYTGQNLYVKIYIP
jgi:hypothetical protein